MEQYKEFKNFLNPVNVKSILEIKSILENTFDNYETKKKEYFLEWLEFSFLNELKLSIKKNNIPNGRFLSESIDKHNEIIKQKIDFIEKWILLKKEESKLNILTEPKAIDLSYTTAIEKKQINNFDANHFNNDCYNLFCYLVDNYKKKGKIKFINIYYYLKDEVIKDKYSFRFIQNEYTEFIKENYKVEIKKYQKATFDFDEQKRVLNSLEEQFRKQ
jgi:hypothetical protein